MRAAAAALALLLAAGCASLQPPEVAGPVLSGRLALQVEAHDGAAARSMSASFDLRGTPEAGALSLSTPLGTTVAEARWRPGEVLLKTTDGERRFADLSALSQEVLGEPVPLAALFDWLRGRPWPQAASAPAKAPAVGFEQLGWQVGLERWSEGWVVARRTAPPVVTVRAKLQNDAQ